MPIGRLEIGRCLLDRGIDIPASASFVRDQGSVIGFCDSLREVCIVLDGLKSIVNRECGSFKFSECFGKVMIRLLREDELRSSGKGHLKSGVVGLVEEEGRGFDEAEEKSSP